MRTLGNDELVQFRAFQQAQAAAQQQHQQYPYAPQQTAAYQPVQAYSPASTAVPIYAGAGSGYQAPAIGRFQPDDPLPSAAFQGVAQPGAGKY